MTMIEILILGGFGVPIAGLSFYFIIAARRMMREEAEREALRRQTARAMQTDRHIKRVKYIAAHGRTGACR